MKVKLQKWGNSCGIRIPKNILDDLDLNENDYLELKIEDKKIILIKSNYKTIEDIIGNYNGSYVCEEYAPYDVEGNELW